MLWFKTWNSNSFEQRSISSLTTEKNVQFKFSLSEPIYINDVGIPAYAKGIIIAYSDAIMIAISGEPSMYIGYRSGGNWSLKQMK